MPLVIVEPDKKKGGNKATQNSIVVAHGILKKTPLSKRTIADRTTRLKLLACDMNQGAAILIKFRRHLYGP